MNTEIIIAARGELPANLERTVEQAASVAPVSVIFDGHEKGNECPPKIAEKANIMRPWDVPQGCGAARHYGISMSEADLIVLVDGHMTFPKGWLEKIEKFHTRRSNFLTCCRMQSLDQSAKPLTDKPEGGAFIAYKSREVLNMFWALSAKWESERKTKGRISAVMGACYAFRKKWYKKIGEPLRMLRAWGGDEEILSLATHLMGGYVEILPIVIGHIYKANHVGRIRTADEDAAIWGNRYALIEALPMADDERAELTGWMRQSRRIINDLPAMPDACYEIRDVLSTGKRSWDEIKDAGIVRPLTEQEQAACLGEAGKQKLRDNAQRPKPANVPIERSEPQVIQQTDTVCERCNAKNSFKQVRGRRNTGAFGIAYAKCNRCGHKAQVRFIDPTRC